MLDNQQKSFKHFRLGASMYVPCTRKDLEAIAHEDKVLARSVIFCTEDSVNEEDLPKALNNLQKALTKLEKTENVMKFIRVRNQEVLKTVLQMDNIASIDGFVFPKITADNFMSYYDLFEEAGFISHRFDIMPTLETKEAFCTLEMEKLSQIFQQPHVKEHILSLRIGGNDLLNILGVRRSRHRTIYESPLAVTISNLVTIFKPHGFNLTAPVCELIQDPEILSKEVPKDLEYALFGKTAIHPDQVTLIENFYKVHQDEMEMAEAMLTENAPAVFQMHGTMCEKATHSNWAREILERAKIYGVLGAN
jgi:citrate lyase beta subunit